MLSIVRILLALVSLLAFVSSLWAQPARLPRPELITDQQGLPQAFVPSIVQDRQGFIWVATRDGLCRYDGRYFKVFQPSADGSPSLSFAGLEQIVLDPTGRIWVVSERGDIDIFDPYTETFVNFSRQRAFQQVVKGRRSRYHLYFGKGNQLWIALDADGLIDWNVATNRGNWFHHQPGLASSLASDDVRGIVEEPNGVVWLATANGLDRFERTTGQFTHYQHQATNPASIPDNGLTGLHARKNGEIVLLSRQYLSVFQTRTGQFTNYPLPAEAYQRYNAHLAHSQQGVVYFNKDATLYEFTDAKGIQVVARERAPNADCASLFVDRTNVLWVGTIGAGIRTYDLQPNPFRIRRYTNSFSLDLLTSGSFGLPPVSSAAAASLAGLPSYIFRSTFDAASNLWFSESSSAIYRLNLKTSGTLPVPLPALFRRPSFTEIPCPLATDPQGRVWVIHGRSAFWYDETNARWIPFPFSIPNQPASAITELVIDSRSLWLASREGGLWQVDRLTGRTRQFANRPNDHQSISSNSLYCLSADPTDTNRLWIGTFGNGLCLFNKRTGKCRRFSQADGLPNNVIYSALPDQQGNLWMGTNKGLCRMNRRTFATHTFTRDDGILADEFNSYHYLKFPNGTLLMGGLEGFTVFQPRQIRPDQVQPFVELTELLINNQPIHQDRQRPASDLRDRRGTSVLGRWPIQATDRLTLTHDQNYITVRFAALQFNHPTRNQYRYKLAGLEPNWKLADRPEAVYTGLPPGDYVLMVNSSNTSGLWSPHIRQLAIIIRPPLWATWWAISLYSLAGLGIAWALVVMWLNRLRLKQSVLLRQQEADQLRAIDTLKTNFFTNITHELRTPLTLILGPTQQMLAESRPASDIARLSTIDRQSNQLLELINQWLEVSRLEAGALPVQIVRGNLDEWLSGWIHSFEPEAQSRNIQLSGSTTLTGAYWFDPDKLARIVSNLLSNALKFTPPGGQVHVELEATGAAPAEIASSASTAGVLLRVADTGVGIPADALPHIFNRFYQVDRPPAAQLYPPGSGIGLSLVQELVALQGGTIRVVSELGQGTQFVVWLPYPLADGPTEPAPLTTTSATSKPTHQALLPDTSLADEPPVVLLVEDNPELANFIAQSLPASYQLHRATNGQQGLEQTIALLPDLVISDVLMPVMDGYAFCQQLKADIRISHVPIILLTAKASLDSRLEGLALGADDYLTKPFHTRDLQLRVTNLLTQRRRLRDYVRESLSKLDSPPTPPALIDPFISQLHTILEAHLDESSFGVEELANQVGMSRSYLFRKVKTLTGLSASELERNYRLQRAAQYLQQGYRVAQTGYLVGFETPAYFSQSFRKLYGITPTDYLKQQRLGQPAD